MNLLLQCILLFAILTLSTDYGHGQRQIKEKTEIAYSISTKDSIPRFRRTTTYDEKGRIVGKQNYYYSPREKGLLTKEEKAYFNPEEQVLTEHIINYPIGKEPVSEKLITKYLYYANREEDSKRIWRQLYDNYGEISREDTLTYDANNNLIERCNYDYRGNTSLFCHYHTYNKKGWQVLWRTYSKWTTINGKGDVVERQAKRRNYRYRYNNNGQLVASGGRHYLNHFRQKIEYDKNGKIRSNKTLLRRKTRQISPKDKSKKTRYRIDKEVQILTYEEGRLISDIKFVNTIETIKKELSYQDTLIRNIKTSKKGIIAEEIEYEYNAGHIISKKTEKKYTPKGKLHYAVLTVFNEQGKAIKEEQVVGKKILSVLEMEYDENGNPLKQSLSTNNNKNFEKTMYIYKYY